jgi:hypothetical protein
LHFTGNYTYDFGRLACYLYIYEACVRLLTGNAMQVFMELVVLKWTTSLRLIRSFTDFHASEAFYDPPSIRKFRMIRTCILGTENCSVSFYAFTFRRLYCRFWHFKSLNYSWKHLEISVLFILVYMILFKSSWRVLIATLYFILYIRHCLEVYDVLRRQSS